MSVIQFLSQLRKLGVNVWLDNDELRYQAPKGVVNKALLSEISEKKAEIIMFLKKVKTETVLGKETIPVAQRSDVTEFPLSYSQQSLWFYDQLIKGNPAFNISNAVKITGELDIEAIEAALRELVKRHEALRTTFSVANGKPVQVARLSYEVKLYKTYLDYYPDDIKLMNILKEEARSVFDLEKGPLFRFHLFILGKDKYVLSMTVHHIISDGWSNTVLVGELFSLYKAYVQKQFENLPELPVQFADYACWERKRFDGDLLYDFLEYWEKQLANPSTLELPLDRKRSAVRKFEGGYESVLVPLELANKLNSFCKSQGVTLFVLLLAAFKTLLFSYSGQKDISIGTVVANRSRKEIERAVGFFMNTLVLRTGFEGELNFLDILGRVKRTTMDAYEHQELPFDKMVEELKPPREDGVNPLFQVMFILQNTEKVELALPGLKIQPLDVESGMAPFDLRLQFTETTEGLKGKFDYNSSIFNADTIKKMAVHLLAALECIVSNPREKISNLPIITQDEEKQIKSKIDSLKHDMLKVSVSSTFTAEPLEKYIKWWCRQFGFDTSVLFAPYNQVFQELLDDTSLISLNTGVNVLLVRFEDWLRDDKSNDEEQIAKLERDFNYMLEIINIKEKNIPYFVGIFPASTHLHLSERVLHHIEGLYSKWKNTLKDMDNVYLIDCKRLNEHYEIDEVFDVLKDVEAHMPFSDQYYGALGTEIARKTCAWKRQQFKVIVVDCDNTLWRGVCAEEKVIVDEPFRRMQAFLLDRCREGMLLSICSKNNETDVWEVFDNNPDMVLKKEHFVSWKINWNIKSSNIKEIAEGLNLGLDSFIFLDDSPLECTEVMVNLPEVLTLNLPDNPSQIPEFLYHAWAFDRLKVTREDTLRTEMYAAEQKRKSMQNEVQSLEGFIKGLSLKMSMNPVENHEIPRAAQLTYRTNQFNLSTIRRTEEEIRQLLDTQGFRCHVIEVSDRFGDYGLVGVVITKECGSRLVVDTFLLSCRVLGRRIEDAILEGLRKLCSETNAKVLEADFRPTEKNMPFKSFLERTGWRNVEENKEYIKFQLGIESIPEKEPLVDCYYNSRFVVSQEPAEADETKLNLVSEMLVHKETVSNNNWKVLSVNPEKLIHRSYLVPLENSKGSDLIKILLRENDERKRKSEFNKREEYVAPRNKIEEMLVEVWEEILGTDNIGVNDDFFQLGGHSLAAVSIIARLKDRINRYIPLQWLLENRTVARLGEVIGEISDGDAEGTLDKEAISRAHIDRKTEFPVSFSQKSMWFYDQINNGNAVFNLSSAVKISGELNINYLKTSLKNTVKRHEALRTILRNIDGNPVQVINDDIEVEIREVDLSHIQANILDEEIDRLLKEEARSIFNLERGPLFRFCLLMLGKNEFVFSMTTHHIISDGWSNTIIVGEFLEQYRALLKGEEVVLEEMPIQFADYAFWEKERFKGDKLESLMGYWRKQLANPTTLELPVDKTRPKNRTYEGGYQKMTIPDELAGKLKSLSTSEGVTLFMLVLAAFQTLLHRYSGQNDIFTGTVVANRNRKEVEKIAGPFLNTLVLRTDFEEDPCFIELLRKVKRTTLEAYEHQEVPFDKILEELKPERSSSRSPLFQVMFILHNNKKAKMELDGLIMQEIDVFNNMAPFDLRLQLTETDNRIKGGFDYNIDLFEASTVERISMHLLNLLENIVLYPEKSVSKLNFITEDEKKQILFDFNNTRRSFPENMVINEYLEEQASKYGSETAVVYEDKKLSYKDLNKKANQLARVLKEKGVETESIVAIMMERSVEMIIAIMGIQKAGGAYLPIDPYYPKDRIDYILKDSGTGILLTHKGFINCGIPDDIEKIDLDDESVFFGDDTDLDEKASSRNISYVIYTSGSTGKPKGTLIEHHSLINRLNWMQKKYPINKEDVILQKTPYTFDVSVWEMFWWSMAGAKVCFLEPGAEKDPGKIVDTIEKNHVTVIHFVPSMLNIFLEYLKETGEINRISGLKQVFASGEALTTSQVRNFKALLAKNGTQLANLYGPTEATIDVSYFDCGLEDYDSVPIGRPIDNIKLLIMDKNMQLQPIGVPGELCIGGVGLAREYLNKPDLTQEKFVQNPFEPGGRIYRTGDLARWRPDGNIEYLGRMDFQVKIRGLRIELGEIEKQLNIHPSVKESVVVAWKKNEGDIQLVGYIVCGNDDMDINGLQAFLGKSLPDYMVPRIFIILDKMPLSPNGKIDRKALPAPAASKDRDCIAPVNEPQRILVDIWKQVLGSENIGINDNFFEIGGDSLKAMQTVIYLRKQGLHMEIRDLFEHQTVENLADCIKTIKINSSQETVTGEVDLIPTQKGFFRKTRTDITHWNISVMLYKKDGFDREILKRVFTKIVEHHDALRMVFRMDGDSVIQYNRGVDGELFELSVFDLTDDGADTARMDENVYALHRSMNLTTGPLVKLALFKREDGDHLFLAIHHLLCDGLSLMMVLEDAAAAYNQAVRNEPIKLPDKNSSLKEWSEKLNIYANSKEFLNEIDYWRELEKRQITLLPTDKMFNEDRHKHDEIISVTPLSDKEIKLLLKEANQRFDTDVKDLLATAFGAAIKEWTGQNNVLIDYKIHGRENIFEDIDVTRTVGWFATEFPAVLDMSKLDDLSTQIVTIRDMFRNVPGRGLGYETLREITLPENKKTLKFNLNPEVLFNYSGDFNGRNNSDFEGFSLSPFYKNLNESPESERKYTLIIELMILQGSLSVTLHYNRYKYYESTMLNLLELFKKNLLKIINLCTNNKFEKEKEAV
ncbi:MAG TPA: amino acid adenylation domain-containing protein [Clostridia bacterium]